MVFDLLIFINILFKKRRITRALLYKVKNCVLFILRVVHKIPLSQILKFDLKNVHFTKYKTCSIAVAGTEETADQNHIKDLPALLYCSFFCRLSKTNFHQPALKHYC